MLRIIVALFLALWASNAVAQSCSEIRFASGTSSGTVSGQVTDMHPQCFTFDSGAGQTARLELTGSENACFTIDGVVDCRYEYSFTTQPRSYTVNVFQLLRSTANEDFTLSLTIR